jgi:hypothetical protein
LEPPVPVAFPLTFGPVALKLTVSPLDCLSEKFPGKPHWLQAGARGSIGCACAGGETVRNNPTAVIAVAAASNWDLFTMINCDIGSPFHLTPSIRKENDLFGRWRENRTRRPLTLGTDHQGDLE